MFYQVKDMMGRSIELKLKPQRIISVVPSQTELLYDLGLDKEVIGITKFCVHPSNWLKTKNIIGGTKKLNLEFIKNLNPDLIIANKEENTKSEIEELALQYPVWISDINTLEDALEMIIQIGEITGKETKAKLLSLDIKNSFEALPYSAKKIPVAYLIWRNPWMCVGQSTFINDMLQRMGWQNVYETEIRYPETNILELKQKSPRYILLSSEPYPFKEKHIEELKNEIPNAKILLVDGELFSWYGSRLKLSSKYLLELSKSQY